MDRHQAEALIAKYNAGNCTEEEKSLVEQWYNDLEYIADAPSADEIVAAKDKVWSQLAASYKEKSIKLYYRITAAAVIFLVIGAGLFYYANTLRHRHAPLQKDGLASNDIQPGGNKAYLTLANGKRLSLTDATNGAIAKEAGVEISKTADGQVIYTVRHNNTGREPRSEGVKYLNALNTIETPRGGQYQIQLPDGSKVWLNAASKLIYPVSFIGRERREVSLDGEAYFEVFKDKLQPFVVKSQNQEVTVLGTHFNINSYADEPNVKTTLLEGRVKVNEAILKPGQQSILSEAKISIVSADLDETMAWKKGDFVFKNEPLESVMKNISRWYDIEVVYAEGEFKHITLGGLVSRSQNLSAVLKMMEMTRKVKFKIEGRRVIVLPMKK